VKTITLTAICAFSISLGALAQSNLILNHNFNQGDYNGQVPVNWSSNAGGTYNYADPAAPSYATGGQIVSLGWWNGVGIWQNTGASIQASAAYELAVTAAVGSAPLTGVTLAFQDVSTGWSSVASQEFFFSPTDMTSGQYETFTLDIPQSNLSAITGDTIGVSINMNENPNTQYGWVHIDSVSLVAVPVPEPSSLALLSLSAISGFTLLRLRKAKS